MQVKWGLKFYVFLKFFVYFCQAKVVFSQVKIVLLFWDWIQEFVASIWDEALTGSELSQVWDPEVKLRSPFGPSK